jgi:multidrug resistance efflux pump
MAQEVSEGPLTIVSETSGTVNPVTQSKVAAQVAGTVAKIRHLAGDWVKAGETVVQLDDTRLDLAAKTSRASLETARINLSTSEDTTAQANPKLALQVQSAQATLASAQKTYDSTKALLDAGGATESQLDSAQSQLQTAQANLESAKTDLDQNNKADKQSLALLKLAVQQADFQARESEIDLQYSSIKAPFAGQISVVYVNPGEYVNTDTEAFLLVSADKEIDFSVSPSDATHLKVGTILNFTYEGSTFKITVRQLPSAPVNGMVPLVASVPASFPISYGAVGMVGYSLNLARGTLIPIAALQTAEDKNYVFTIENGKAVMRTVTIIAESGVQAAVSGISGGTQVIVSPQPGLLEGSLVQIAKAGKQ